MISEQDQKRNCIFKALPTQLHSDPRVRLKCQQRTIKNFQIHLHIKFTYHDKHQTWDRKAQVAFVEFVEASLAFGLKCLVEVDT